MIATFMVPGTGPVSLVNGSLENINPNLTGSTDGLNLKVFVNDEMVPRISMSTAPGTGSTATFGNDLGPLIAGSKIYVAVGSRDDDGYDGFDLKYDIHFVPEPNMITLAAICSLIGWVAFLGRVQRANLPRINMRRQSLRRVCEKSPA